MRKIAGARGRQRQADARRAEDGRDDAPRIVGAVKLARDGQDAAGVGTTIQRISPRSPSVVAGRGHCSGALTIHGRTRAHDVPRRGGLDADWREVKQPAHDDSHHRQR
ncbi:MAG: hypothetical protein ACLR8Y_00080 [Alistipes indistinctus]